MDKLSSKRLTKIAFSVALMGLMQISYAEVSGDYQTAYSSFQMKMGSLYNIDMPLKINVDPGPGAARFFSEQFAIGPYTGYLGLQTDMSQSNGQVTKGAIFSIWNATSAVEGSPGTWCQTFGGEGIGYSCRMPYNWTAGTTYRLRVWQITANSWAAFVKDLTTGIEVQLGTITIPSSKYWLQASLTTFTEYYGGDFPACSDLKLSRVTWGMPVGNNSSVPSTWVSNSIGQGDCASIRSSVGRGPTVQSVGQ